MEEILRKIFKQIVVLQKEVNLKWIKSEDYIKFNYKTKEVVDINLEDKLQETIFNYRKFLVDNDIDLFDYGKNYLVNSRIKNIDSIYDKIYKYTHYHNNGKEPINKCFNDLFGVRIIFNYDFSFDDINNVFEKIKSDYDINLKCIDSSKKDYVATHIYFKIDNYNFPWELQIWSIKDAKNNIISHSKYKQEYKEWQDKLKGGDIKA